MRIGYNSMGADCIANNLHFHLVYADKMFEDVTGKSLFPIETCQKKLFYTSTLKHLAEGEVDMYSCGVRFGEVKDWPVETLVLSPDLTEGADVSLEDA